MIVLQVFLYFRMMITNYSMVYNIVIALSKRYHKRHKKIGVKCSTKFSLEVRIFTILRRSNHKYIRLQYNYIYLYGHSSETGFLCLMKWSSETLQNLAYFCNTIYPLYHEISYFILCHYIFYLNKFPAWSMSTQTRALIRRKKIEYVLTQKE